MLKDIKTVFCLISVVSVILLLSCLPACGNKKGVSQGGPPEVAVVVIKTDRVPVITELPGRTSAYLVADVRPQVNGIIQNRFFTEGSNVRAGDVLYRIDPAIYEAAYAGAKAALARAEANVVSIGNRVKRYKDLVEINAISKQDYDDAVAALKQSEAEVEANKAATESARINLSYTNIKAPISGRIGKSNVTVGALVTANQPSALAVIQQLDPIYVDATQSSSNLLDLKRHIAAGKIKGSGPDQAKVKLVLEDGTLYPQEGNLKFSDVTVDPSTGSFILRMVFPNSKNLLLPGMYVRAVVQEGIADNAVLAPQQGVTQDPKGNPVCLIVNDQDKVEQRALKVDRTIGDKWLVADGLNPGDRLIVEGIQKVRPGISVKVVMFGEDNREDQGMEKAGKLPENVIPSSEKAK